MGFNEIIGLFDNLVSTGSGYNNKNNSLVESNTSKDFKFNKVVDNLSLYDEYKNELLKNLQYNSVFVPTNQITNTFILFGNPFDKTFTFMNLINKVIDEFIIETFPFSMNLIEINNIGSFDFINNKYFNFNDEYQKNFSSSKIYLDPLDKTFITRIFEITDKIDKNYKFRTLGSHLILTFENVYHKIRIYNLEDFNCDPFTMTPVNSSFITLEISYLNSLLTSSNTSPKNKNKSTLTKLLQSDLKISNISKVLFRFCKNLRLLNLSTTFYNYFQNKNSNKLLNKPNKNHGQLILYKEIDPIKKYDSNKNLINNTFDFNKITSHFNYIKPIPNENLNKMSTSLIKYVPKTPIHSPIENESFDAKPDLIIPKDYNEINKPMEIVKYVKMFSQDQTLIFDKLKVLNKFVFDSTVKNQIKLQIGHKDNTKIAEVNKDLLINMKSLLSVVLDQLNQI